MTASPIAEALELDTRSTERLSIQQYAPYIGVSVQTAYQWRSAGVGPRSYKLGRRVYADRADLDRWLDEQKVRSARGE